MAFVQEAIKLAHVNPKCMGVLGAPTYGMIEDTIMPELLQVLGDNEVPYEFLKSEHSIYLPGPRSTILFRSLDHPDRLRGKNVAWFGIDEATYCSEKAWEQLEARLRDPKAKQLCGFATFTPKGFDWCYRRFKVQEKGDQYRLVHGHWYNSPILRTNQTYYETLRASYDPRFFQQEVLGEFLALHRGMAYPNFSDAANLRSRAWDPNLPLCFTLDFNVDPFCSLLAQRHGSRAGSPIHVLEEIVLRDARTPGILAKLEEVIQERYRTLQRLQIYGDPAGVQRRSSASSTDWEIVHAWAEKQPFRVSFHVESKAPFVKDRVNAVNAMLENAEHKPRLTVDPSCKYLIADFYEVGWAADSDGNMFPELDKKNKLRTHASDALGYMVWAESDLRQHTRSNSGTLFDR
jgi:hypothetical protein